jgi:ABC-type transport system substrate-binding protein
MRCRRFVPLAGLACAALAFALPSPSQSGQASTSPADLEKTLLARPADLVERADGSSFLVEPPAADTLLDPQFSGDVVLQEIGDEGQPPHTIVVKSAGLRYVPFERRVLDAIAKDEQTNSDEPALARWSAIEKVLTLALRLHLTVRERPAQGGNRWSDVQKELEHKLLEVRRRLLREWGTAAQSAEDWARALRYGDQVASPHTADQALLDEVGRLRMRLALWTLFHQGDKKLTAGDYRLVHQQLEWLEENCQKSPPADVIGPAGDTWLQSGRRVPVVYQRDALALARFLESKAKSLVNAAATMPDDKQAIRQLEEAMQLWPRLPGLFDALLKRKGEYTILNVGVRQLPVYLAPPLACTDAELQAVELLFEGLVQAQPDDMGHLRYPAQLATDTGVKIDGGRSFFLARNGYWSDGKRLTQADVQRTFQFLTNPALPGLPTHAADLADAVDLPRVDDDLFRVAFHYRKGLLDPLAPFAFKVLPRSLAADPQELERFAQAPVGSGPYHRIPGTLAKDGRTYVVFRANPYYYGRPGRPVPQIREVRFFVSTNPAQDFDHKTAPLHLLLDVPLTAIGPLKKASVKELRTLQPRRVWFLAVNSADKLLADVNLRRALAHGIDRTRLLADHFRGAIRPNLGAANYVPGSLAFRAALAVPTSNDHRPLNGPFPADAWACCTDGRVPPGSQVFDPDRARKLLKDTKLSAISLQLKYPNNDPRVAGACQAMQEQFKRLGASADCPITIELVPLAPHQLRRDLLLGDYQLAYWHHDFPNDTYSLWSLLDFRMDDNKNKVANYLGYSEDGTLSRLLVKASSYRDFKEVQKQTHDLHDHLYMTMPLIPLWQLDVHIAVHPDLALPAVDPLRVFSNIEQWKLARR